MEDLFKVIAPTRVDLAGGTGDIWPLYCIVGDRFKTINLAVDLFQTVTFEVHASRNFELSLKSQTASAEIKGPFDREKLPLFRPELQFPAFVLSEGLKGLKELPQISIHVGLQSDVPVGSGLGGSSALCVALIRGLTRIIGGYTEQGWQWNMLPWVRDVEARFLQTATGTQDYLASLFGGLSAFTSRLGGIDRFTYSETVTSELNSMMFVLFSGQMHHSGLSNWEIQRRAMEGDKDVRRGLTAIGEIADSLDTELRLSNRDYRAIGQLLSSEWRIRRELFRVNTPRLEEIMNQLKGHRIWGAKVCGAAAGGSVLVLSEPSFRNEIATACERLGIRVLRCSASPLGVSIRS